MEIDKQNRYIVTWDIQADTRASTANINSFSGAVKAQTEALLGATKALKAYQKELNSLKKMGATVGGAPVGQGRGAFPAGSASNILTGMPFVPNVYGGTYTPNKPTTSSQKSSVGKSPTSSSQSSKSGRGGAGGKGNAASYGARGGVGGRYISPLKGTPFGGLMGTLLAYSAVSSNIVEATEYGNLMATSKSFLKTADTDLATFEDRFDRLAKKVRSIGVETKFSASEVAGATKYLAMAGMNMDTINKSIKPIADLAVIGDEDLSLVADLSTNIMTGYGLDSGAMKGVSDIISSTMTRSNVSITEIAESFKMSAGYLSSAGIDFSEATGAIGVLGDAGMKATLAGTALRAMMIRFAKPTREAVEIMNKLGVSFTEDRDVGGKTVNKVRSLYDIFSDLKDKGASLEDLQRMFGTIGGNAALQLINRTDKLKELTLQNITSHGTADLLSKEKKATATNMWHQMVSTFKDQFLTAYLELEPAIMETLGSLTRSFASAEFVDGLKAFGSTLLYVLDAVTEIGIWVGKNWNWLQPLFIGNILYSKVSGLANGVMSLGRSIASLGMAGAGIGGWVSVALAGASVLVADYWQFKSNIEAGDKALANVMKKSPKIADDFAEWAKSVGVIKDNLYDIDGKMKSISQDGEGAKPLSEVTGVPDIVHSIGGALMGENWKQTNIAADKQLTALREIKRRKAYDSALGALLSLDPLSFEGASFGKTASQMVDDELQKHYNLPTPVSMLASHWGKKRVYDREWYSRDPSGRYDWSARYKWVDDDDFDPSGFVGHKYVGLNTESDALKSKEFQDMYMPTKGEILGVAQWYIDAVSSQASATSTFKDLIGDNLGSYFKKVGLFGDDGLYNPKFLDGLKTMFPETYVAELTKIRDIFSNFITESKDGDDNAVPPQALVQILRVMGVDSKLWGNTPLNSNKINIASSLDGYDEGGAGGSVSKTGLQGSRVTPRQVIVNLDNLMNVELVNINQDNQDETIERFKEKLNQALTDIVADFSNAYHS